MPLSQYEGDLILSYQNIIVERDGTIATITLNRPQVLNALNRNIYCEMDDALGEIREDDGTRVVIITGAGDRAFSAGADIHEMVQGDDAHDARVSEHYGLNFVWHVASFPKPIIGAINGLAYGGGAVLATSFDIRVGCERTSFRFLAASYGRINATWNLPQQVGWPVAKELLFTAREVDSTEANRIGLLNYLVSGEELMAKALELANQIADNDPRMVQGIKKLVTENVGSTWHQMYRREKDSQDGELRPTPVSEAFKDFLGRKGRK